jgi:hypothetical protein
MAKKVDAAPLWAALLSGSALADAASRCWPGGDAMSKLARWFGGRRTARDAAALLELERWRGSLEVERARAAGARMLAHWAQSALETSGDAEAPSKGPGASEIRAMVDLIKATQPRAMTIARKTAAKAALATPAAISPELETPQKEAAFDAEKFAREAEEEYDART